MNRLLGFAALLGSCTAGPVFAQPSAAAPAGAPGCVQGARNALAIVARAHGGGSTSAVTHAELRRAVEQMTAAARSAQVELAGCTTAPGTAAAQRGGAPPPAMDHSTMKKPSGGATRSPTGARATRGAPPPAPVDHSRMKIGSGQPADTEKPDPRMPVMPAERVMDPACADADIATAPKAAFDRKIYYFCSDLEREEFRKNPAAYLKKRPRG